LWHEITTTWACRRSQTTPVAARWRGCSGLAADDAPLHVVVRQRDDGHAALGHELARHAFDRDDDLLGAAIGFLAPVLDLANRRRRPLAPAASSVEQRTPCLVTRQPAVSSSLRRTDKTPQCLRLLALEHPSTAETASCVAAPPRDVTDPGGA
jgi:hypothetical protein